MPAWIQRSTLRSPCWRDTMCGRKRVRLRSSSRRSEEHTSELQSQSNLVCRLLLEKKKKYAKLGFPPIQHTLPLGAATPAPYLGRTRSMSPSRSSSRELLLTPTVRRLMTHYIFRVA